MTTTRKFSHILIILPLCLSFLLSGALGQTCFSGDFCKGCNMKDSQHGESMESNSHAGACRPEMEDAPCSCCLDKAESRNDIGSSNISFVHQKSPASTHGVISSDNTSGIGGYKGPDSNYRVRNVSRSSPIYLKLLSILC